MSIRRGSIEGMSAKKPRTRRRSPTTPSQTTTHAERVTTREAVNAALRHRSEPPPLSHEEAIKLAMRLQEVLHAAASDIARGSWRADEAAEEVHTLWATLEGGVLHVKTAALYGILSEIEDTAHIMEPRRLELIEGYVRARFPAVTSKDVRAGIEAWGPRAYGRWKRVLHWARSIPQLASHGSAENLRTSYAEWRTKTGRKS